MRRISVLVGDTAGPTRGEMLRKMLGDEFVVEAAEDYDLGKVADRSIDADVIVTNRLPRKIIQNAPNLKLVQSWNAGADSFQIDLLREHNVTLCSNHGNDYAVAEHALALLLSIGRHVVLADRKLREGHWGTISAAPGFPFPSVRGRTVGLIGFGSILRAFTRISQGMGFKYMAIKRQAEPGLKEEFGLDFIGTLNDMDSALASADYVVVALPKTPKTIGIIDERRLRQMKSTAYLIQVGRGDTIHEEALYRACKERWIAGAAIDTWYHYPPPEPRYPSRFPFQELDNVIMTPHSAGWSREAVEDQVQFVAANLRRFREGQPLERLVDLELGY